MQENTKGNLKKQTKKLQKMSLKNLQIFVPAKTLCPMKF